jgi:hypothetical protein
MPVTPLRVLFTNQAFDQPAGTEQYIRDVALELKRRGHEPFVYSPACGAIDASLRNQGVLVCDVISDIGAVPDVIHGHHHLETLTALLRFRGTPAVGFCHGLTPWQEAPLRHPRIAQYVGVSEPTRNRVLKETGAPPERVHWIPNFVDLDRFRPRPPLPAKPTRALVLDNYIHEGNGLRTIREACQQTGLSLDVVGQECGAPTNSPERILPQYDIVFAVGRSALEALAVGSAVIVGSVPGLGGMVTPQNLDDFRRRNFGLTSLTPCGPEEIVQEIRAYQPESALDVSQVIRETAGLKTGVDRLVSLYQKSIDIFKRDPPSLTQEISALAKYFEEWGPKYRYWKIGGDAVDCRAPPISLRQRLMRLVQKPGEINRLG